jgi:4a-hydroxytetrahydrobiopterin dehydratase
MVDLLMKEEAGESQGHLDGWKIVDSTIEKNCKFDNFRKAVEFINKVADVAERYNHHPDILLWNWNNVRLVLTTDSLKGLLRDDFVHAANIDKVISR